MSLLPIRLAAGAFAGAFVASGTVAAYAHAVCGARIFPQRLRSTTGTIQPGVVYMRTNGRSPLKA